MTNPDINNIFYLEYKSIIDKLVITTIYYETLIHK